MKEKMENQMNNIKISMLTIMLILCALSGVQACIVYTAPDGVRMSSLQMGRFCEIEQYIQTSAEMCEFIEQSGIENNSAFLLEIYAAGESETNIAGCFGHNPVMPSKGLTGTSRCLFMFAGIFGTLAAFGKKRYEHAKRLFDIIVAAVALIILSPLILLCMLIIRIDSKGPVLFRQIRVGINRRSSPNRRKGLTDPFRNLMPRRNDENLGRLFYMYKLRTMCIDRMGKEK
jgi:hypothetical protein